MRQVLAGLAAILVLGAAVFVVLRALDANDPTQETAADVPAETVDAYLDAWERGDHDAMAELVRDPPEVFVTAHEQLRDGLALQALITERIALAEDVDGRATATVTVTADLPTVGELGWEVELRLLRERGRWGIAWEPASLHPDWRPGLRFVTTTVEVDRAPILATDGTPLAGPGQRVTFGVEPGAVSNVDEVVAAFEAAIPGSGDTAARVLGQRGLVDGWFYPVVSLSADEARDAGRSVVGVAGILRRTEDGARSLLADGFAVHVVGRTGEATAEELERLGPPYEPGDIVGRSGLEQALEADLTGRELIQVELRDGESGPVRATLATVDADGGPTAGPLTTTLDVTVQRAIENTLLGRDSGAAIVVVDTEDGAIRGSASRPLDEFDRALQGRYPPGPAFAPVVIDAWVAAGGDPTDDVDCPAEAVHAGRRVENVAGADLGRVPLAVAATGGCATSLAALGAELGAGPLGEAAARFGAGRDLDLPLFSNGLSFPDPVDLGEATVAASGQGRVEVSPLHAATVAAAAATGRWSPPYLLEDAGAGDGPRDGTALAPGALDGTRRLLVASDEVEGLAGFAATAAGLDGVVHSWFLGTVDDLAIAVLVEDDGSDGSAAGLAVRFARELMALADAPVDGSR